MSWLFLLNGSNFISILVIFVELRLGAVIRAFALDFVVKVEYVWLEDNFCLGILKDQIFGRVVWSCSLRNLEI